MTEDELRRAYGALRDQQRERVSAAGEPARPAPEAIWSAVSGEMEPGERVRILDEALRSGASDELAFSHAMHTAARSAAGAASPSKASRFGGTRRWWSVAAAAALLMAVGVPLWQDAGNTPASRADTPVYRDGTRPSGPLLIAPDDSAPLSPGGRFAWRPLADARQYAFEAFDAAGGTVTTVNTTDTVAVLPDSVAGATRRHISGWWVTATMANGTTRRSELRVVASPQRP